MSEWIVVDTETTGFSPKTDRLIEFGAAEFDPISGQLGQMLHLQVNPGIEVPAAITALTGITTADLSDKPKFAEVMPDIADFVKGRLMVAHSAAFDTGFLKEEFRRAKSKAAFDDLPAKIICSRKLARYGRPNVKADLSSLCEAFGIDQSLRTKHGAMMDCFLLAQVYPHIAKLAETRDRVLSGLLPWTPGAALPQDRDELLRSYLMMSELKNRIEAEQERAREVLAHMLANQDLESEDATVTFGPPSTKTDWQKIRETFLKDVDLKPFQKTGKEPSMTIKAA